MRTKTVKRYYCDHCNRGMFQQPAMASHELTCIANPHRVCFLCNAPVDTFNIPFLAYSMQSREDVELEEMEDGEATGFHVCKSVDAIQWLYSKVDGCPCCVLAVLKQGKINAFGVFDYKKELEEWHREQNQETF